MKKQELQPEPGLLPDARLRLPTFCIYVQSTLPSVCTAATRMRCC